MGKPSDLRLQPFSEAMLKQQDPNRTLKRNALQQLHQAGMACKALCQNAILFGSFQTDMFRDSTVETPDQQRKRQDRAAYDATEVLVSTLVRSKLFLDKAGMVLDEEEKDDGNSDGTASDADSDLPSGGSVGKAERMIKSVLNKLTVDSSFDELYQQLIEMSEISTLDDLK